MNNPHLRDIIARTLEANAGAQQHDLVLAIERAVEPFSFEVPLLSEANAVMLAQVEMRRSETAHPIDEDYKPQDWIVRAIRAASGHYLSPFDFADDPSYVAEPDRAAHVLWLKKLDEWCMLDRKGMIEALVRENHANEPWRRLMDLVGAWQDGSQTTVTLHQDDATKTCHVSVEGHGATYAKDFKTAVLLASHL